MFVDQKLVDSLTAYFDFIGECLCRYECVPHACTVLGGKKSLLRTLELKLQIAVSCRVVLGTKFQSCTGTFTYNVVSMGLMPSYDLRGYLPVHGAHTYPWA